MRSKQSIHYTLCPKHPEAHLFEVTCTIQHPDPSGQSVGLPAWIPGSYMIRDFARNVVQLEAFSENGAALEVSRSDKSRWRIAPAPGPITVRYDVYAWDLSVRAAHLDITHGYFNGASVFVEVEGQSNTPCSLEIIAPAGDVYNDWRVATSMPRNGAELYGFGLYQATGYDELIDHPVEMGSFELAGFEAGGIPHDVVITGRQRSDMDRLCKDLKQICETHIALFGELPPMERYTFLIMTVGDGYGGLEHRASTSLLCSRDDLPLVTDKKVNEGYRTFLGLCSHEYFHTWNVKRIKPQAFIPYDLSKETHTRQLWAFEGITSYYDDLALLRAGVIETESYLELLGQTITRVWRGAGRFKQSVADSSFDAWTKFYKQDENAPNAIVSYYTKGAVLALALDLTLRKLSGGQKSLDDLMRLLWRDYGKNGKGMAEGEIEQCAAELANADLSDFFQHYLYGTEDPPLAALFNEVGIDFTLRAASSVDDKGGKPATDATSPVTLGARIVNNQIGAGLSHVFDQGPTQKAGLSAGDVVIAVDGLKVDKAKLEKMLSGYEANAQLKVHAFRRDELMTFTVTLQPAPKDTCVLTLMQNADEQQLSKRKMWLHQDASKQG